MDTEHGSVRRRGRRDWLRGALVLGAAGFLPFAARSATVKAGKQTVHYQDTPKDGKVCGHCRFYIAYGAKTPGQGMMGGAMGPAMMRDGTCQVVEGAISPHGYCDLFVAI